MSANQTAIKTFKFPQIYVVQVRSESCFFAALMKMCIESNVFLFFFVVIPLTNFHCIF